jgi:hypothetical protein
MGSDIKVFKSDTEDMLQKKVNAELQKLPAPDVLKKLESIDPDKLVTVLKKDCFGIFIDLTDVSCIRCNDNSSCATAFIKNLKGEMKVVDAALPSKEKVASVTRYKPDRLVFVRDVPNPNPKKSDDLHDTSQAILDEEPGTLAELREIVARDFNTDDDDDFMEFVTTLRDPVEGIIKLDVDLTEKDKVELRKAGYEI